MSVRKNITDNPLQIIQDCVRSNRIFWTYHVNMRLRIRSIPRSWILQSVDNFEIIEEYPEDKYLPSYLVWSSINDTIFHILFAIDMEENNVRVVTAYKPDPSEWTDNLKRRIYS